MSGCRYDHCAAETVAVDSHVPGVQKLLHVHIPYFYFTVSNVNTVHSSSVSLTRWRSEPSQPRILVSDRNGLACSTMVHREQTKSPFSLCPEAILQKLYLVHSYLLIPAVDELGCAKGGGHHEEEEGRVQENVLGEN